MATACVGVTGEQVLHSLNARMGSLIDVNDVLLKHIFIIMAQAFGLKLFIFAVISYESRSRVEPSLELPPPLQLSVPEETTATDEVEGASARAQADALLAPAACDESNDVELAIDDVSLQLDAVGDETEGKFLLKNVSAACKAREILSIMGPSGAGKTTLLKVLSCQPSPGRSDHITGRITLNGLPMTVKLFRDHCAYMPQNDAGLFVFLSCEAHIYYAVSLFQGRLDASQCAELTDAILLKMGLNSCKKTRAGSPEYPGLSGGQRRRLSLALTLANAPALLVADEPTTGLDDAAAVAIMKLLNEVAVSSKMAIVATIHQPGSTIYRHMGSLLLLSRARTAYCGQAGDVIEHVNRLGKPAPLGVSIAEHVLNLINADFASEAEVDALLDTWQKMAPPLLLASLPKPLPPAPERPPFLRVLMVLFQKMAAILSRSHSFTRNKVLNQLLLSLFYGFFAVGIHDREQEDVIQAYFATYFIFGNVIFHNTPGTLSYLERWPSFKGELTAGMYEPGLYWLISALLDMAVNVLAAVAAVVPLSLLINVPANSYFGLVCTIFSFFTFFSALLELGSLHGFEAACFICGQAGTHVVFSSGVFLDADTVIWPFRAFYYILPGRYTFNSLVQLSFGDEHDEWHGAYRVSSAPQEIRDSPAGREALNTSAIFVCPDSDVCFGDNGREVKIGLAAIHSEAATGFSWGVNFLVVMALTLAVRLIGVISLKRQMKSRDQYTGTVEAASSVTEQSKLLA